MILTIAIDKYVYLSKKILYTAEWTLIFVNNNA